MTQLNADLGRGFGVHPLGDATPIGYLLVAPQVILSVQDNGPGVSVQQRRLLQERWKRGAADPSLADGHGLGWSIIAAYARHLGAVLSMSDAPGAGLLVSVTLRASGPGSTEESD